MSLFQILGGVVVLAAGVVLGWVLYRLRASRLERELSAAEATLGAVREQADKQRLETELLRQRVEQEQTLRARAEADLANQRVNLEEQRRLLSEAESQLREAFDSLAGKALEQSSEQFLKLAQERFSKIQEQASGDLSKREEAIKGLVNPLATTLKTLEERLTQDESSRREDYGSLAEQLRKLTVTGEDLRKETGSLVTSLRQPQIRGKWGELLLRRALELTGMSPYCDFVEQPTTETEDREQRPDLIVKLPGGGLIVIDSKVPQGAFLNALAARSQEEYWAAMAEHARLVRNHITKLSARKYWEQFPQSPEFVVLFLPAESFFSAALEQDRTLIEDAMEKHIVLASPTTLLALLRAVAHGWRQERLAENAQKISDLGKELYDRVTKFAEHMEGIRSGLEKANKSFNTAVGSLETRVLPSARKLKDQGVRGSEELPALEQTETALRALNPPAAENDT